MSFDVQQTRRFARQYKKLHNNIAADVDTAVKEVVAQPSLGERKQGDLAELFVRKFHSQGQLYLLGYTVEESVRLIYLEAVGSHENFYRDLKRS
ncbi:MAG: type II toxin-antitoxin system RelE/ParE family toxin [Sedimenticola sp.]